MHMVKSPEQLAGIWRDLADSATESGDTPLIPLGMDSLHPDSGFSLLALARIARRNLGPLSPAVVAGGEGELWLLATLLWQRPAADSPDDAEVVIYAGADPATHAATLNLAVRPSPSPLLPPGMAWMLTPGAAPGAARSDVEHLPLALAEDEFMPASAPAPGADWLDQLERWFGLLLAIGLLIGAVLV